MAPPLKVAIVGAGPAGLATAIQLARLPFVDWQLYEKKPAVSEISSGLTLQRNTWRMLEHLGAARHLGTADFFRPAHGHTTQHRNGRTGVLVSEADNATATAPHQEPCRAHRAVLQQALLREVDQSRVHVGRRLVAIAPLPSGRLRLAFDGGWPDDEVDLLVGADGLRSVVRAFAFPDHAIAFTGATAYRALVRTSDALQINGLPREVIFWHGTDSKWVYTCPLGGDAFEITCRVVEGASGANTTPDEEDARRARASWGRDASVPDFVRTYADFAPPIQQLLQLVTSVQQYDFFAGPRLDTVVARGAIALVGDASHPLSGAFGGGAGFAFEDAYVLAGALAWAFQAGGAAPPAATAAALALYDRVRSPHYAALYGILDAFGQAEKDIASKALSADDEIRARIESVWSPKHNWIYHYEVDAVLAQAIREADAANESKPTLARL